MEWVPVSYRKKDNSTLVIINFNLRFFMSSGNINEKGDGLHRGFGYLSRVSDSLGNMEPKSITVLLQLSTSIIQMGSNISNVGQKIYQNR